MLKKFFRPRSATSPEKTCSSSSESGESETVSPEEIRAATEGRYFFRKPTHDFAPKLSEPASDRPPSGRIPKSRSFSFRFRPHSSSVFKIPRSKSVHFADEVQVVSSGEAPESSAVKSPVSDEANQSSSSVYTEDTAESSTSEETLKRVGASLETIFRNEDESSDDLTTADESSVENADPVLSTISQHLNEVLELIPASQHSPTLFLLETDIHTAIDDLAANWKTSEETSASLRSTTKMQKQENLELLAAVKFHEERCDKVEREKQELLAQLEQTETQNLERGVTRELAEAYQKIEELITHFEREMARNEKSIQAQHKEMESMKQVIQASEIREKQLSSELISVVEKCKSLENTISSANSTSDETEKVKQAYEEQLAQLRAEKVQVEQQWKQSAELLACDLAKERESLIEQHRAEIERITGEFEEKHQSLTDEQEKLNSQLKQDLQTANVRLEAFTEKIQSLELQKAEFQKQLALLQKEQTTWEESTAKAEEAKSVEVEKSRKLLAANNTLRTRNLEMKSQLSKGASELDKCQCNITKLEASIKTYQIKKEAHNKHYQAVAQSNTFALEFLKKLVKRTFEVMAPAVPHLSTEQFTQIYYEFFKLKLLDASHNTMVTLISTFIINAVQNIIQECVRTQQSLEREIKRHEAYKVRVLRYYDRITRRIVHEKGAASSESGSSDASGCKNTRKPSK